MDALQFVASLVSSLAWPALVLAVVLILRKGIAELLGRVLEAEGFGVKAKFDPKRAEPSVALAKAEAEASAPAATVVRARAAEARGQAWDATVRVRESLASTLAAFARKDPGAAVLLAYAEIEKALKHRMTEAKVGGVEKLSGEKLVEVALRKAIVSLQTAEAIRGVLVLRNLAAHGGDVDAAKALEYLSLADAVIFAIETWRKV